MLKKLISIFALILTIVLISACTWGTKDVEPPEDAEEEADVIITSPQPDEEVSFPLTVRGKARGNWFFEAELNLLILDDEGAEIAQGYATSQDEEWMTMDLVNFEGTIDSVPEGSTGGTLVIEENNPASPEERGREVWRFEIPVSF